MNNIAIYPGTFDPITKGHVDLVKRAAEVFSEVIVAIAENPGKSPLFSLTERVLLASEVLAAIKNVKVAGFNNLLTDFARENGAKIIIRGLRAVSDFDYEFQLAGMNRYIFPELETIFMMPSEQYTFVSSSLVREISKLGGDVSPFVPTHVVSAMEKMRKS